MEKTVHSKFAAIHPFQIAHEVSIWLASPVRKRFDFARVTSPEELIRGDRDR